MLLQVKTSSSVKKMSVRLEEGMTEPDIEAAQQLVQLSSGEEEDSEESTCSKKKEEEGMKQALILMTGRRRDECDQDEENKEDRPRKRQRFQSVVTIYKLTQPITYDRHGF
ncbi:unnamed protein product [Musa acuminata subsp. burmannicoides]